MAALLSDVCQKTKNQGASYQSNIGNRLPGRAHFETLVGKGQTMKDYWITRVVSLVRPIEHKLDERETRLAKTVAPQVAAFMNRVCFYQQTRLPLEVAFNFTFNEWREACDRVLTMVTELRKQQTPQPY